MTTQTPPIAPGPSLAEQAMREAEWLLSGHPETCDSNWLKARLAETASLLRALSAATPAPAPPDSVTVRYDLWPAAIEGKLRDGLIALGWTPPGAPAPATHQQGLQVAQAQAVPDVLFDGHAVLKALSEKAARRTGPENVSDVLDAVVSLLRTAPASPVVSQQLTTGEVVVTTDRDGRCVLVSRQDDDGQILSVIWQHEGPYTHHNDQRETPCPVAEHAEPVELNLQPVIAWLENGCDPKEAAKELRIYQHMLYAAPQAPQHGSKPDQETKAELTDERIDALWRVACERHDTTQTMVRAFARSIRTPGMGVDGAHDRDPLPHVPPLSFAVFDEFGSGADDRVHSYAIVHAAAAQAAERERCAKLCDAYSNPQAPEQAGSLDAWLDRQRINGGPHGFECVGREALGRVWAAAHQDGSKPGQETRAEFDSWMEDRYPDRDDRQSEFRMTSARDLMREAFESGFGAGCVRGSEAALASHGMTHATGWQTIETAPKERNARFIGLASSGRAVTAEPSYGVYDGPPVFRGWHEVERGSLVSINLIGWMPMPDDSKAQVTGMQGDKL